jgi:hypothetical protein
MWLEFTADIDVAITRCQTRHYKRGMRLLVVARHAREILAAGAAHEIEPPKHARR